jgi:hypothetical protein
MRGSEEACHSSSTMTTALLGIETSTSAILVLLGSDGDKVASLCPPKATGTSTVVDPVLFGSDGDEVASLRPPRATVTSRVVSFVVDLTIALWMPDRESTRHAR